MPSFLHRTVTLPQERRAIAERLVRAYEIEDETPIEGGRRVTHWDTDGPDTVLAVFGSVTDDGIETISLHVGFEPGTTHVWHVHALMVSNGGDIGHLPEEARVAEEVRYEQEVLRKALERSAPAAAPSSTRTPRRL